MSHAQRSAPLWAIHDGHVGNARQVLALARALGDDTPVEPLLHPTAPWRWLAPRRLPGDARAFGSAFHRALAAPPRLALGCGRQAALATRLARARGAVAVQILDPRIDPRHWDQVIVPEHDGLRGENVITLLGSLHPVDDAWLAAGRDAFPTLGTLPGPRIALLIGGPTARVPWDAQALAAEVEALALLAAQQGGSLMATTSRRTPAEVVARLRTLPIPLWTGAADEGPNPYAGLLGWADAIACTADSSNLLSEACATRVPVLPLFAERAQGRAAQLLAALEARGRLSALPALLPGRAMPPLRETERVAAELAQRLGWPAR
ncbi:nucleoside-diphosphate sugar epimerase [Stenotrophomonas panacihumi]|uniref:Nucleoside-diphosphate sugar epimerase n=1 Tax=Stenotrophomonas panacihumi TaxID=676599 RepID=A0A0R0AGT9_9GAMM|nr:mitochondrial fission ELM1 family protein [Stenotrophomonas panacihumi]KRG44189.1 nucleoside-diphosphate sugar epimerase [Stenotrophomonas panacihumi]PTN56253.1 nucleoside-diphosphate sugar epimerase [Stenotrophomonas panacihumi]